MVTFVIAIRQGIYEFHDWHAYQDGPCEGLIVFIMLNDMMGKNGTFVWKDSITRDLNALCDLLQQFTRVRGRRVLLNDLQNLSRCNRGEDGHLCVQDARGPFGS